MIKLQHVLLCATAPLFAVSASLAQTGPTSAVGGEPSAQENAKAQLRVFVLPIDEASGAVVARAQVKGMDSPSVVASAPAGRAQADAGYRDFPAGEGGYEVLAADKAVASGPLRLMPKRAYTIVAWQGADRAWQTKLFADDSASSSRPMRVLNFVPGRQSLVTSGEAEGAAVPASAVREVPVPAKIVDIRTQVQDPTGGPPFQTSTAFDFAQAGSGYLLIAPDYRGKPDVRVLPGGFVEPPAEDLVAATAITVPTASEIRNEAERSRNRSLNYLKQSLADLEALQAGPNKIPNADAIRRDLEQQLRTLQSPPAPEPTPATATE